MNYAFYDVRKGEKVVVPVVAKIIYGNSEKCTYGLRGVTEDGRNVVAFCNQDTFNSFKVKTEDKRKK